MEDRKDAQRILYNHGIVVLEQTIRNALAGKAPQQKYILDRFLGRPIKLKGKNPKALVKSLMVQAGKPGVRKEDIDTAIQIIKVFVEASHLEAIEDRLEALESKKLEG